MKKLTKLLMTVGIVAMSTLITSCNPNENQNVGGSGAAKAFPGDYGINLVTPFYVDIATNSPETTITVGDKIYSYAEIVAVLPAVAANLGSDWKEWKEATPPVTLNFRDNNIFETTFINYFDENGNPIWSTYPDGTSIPKGTLKYAATETTLQLQVNRAFVENLLLKFIAEELENETDAKAALDALMKIADKHLKSGLITIDNNNFSLNVKYAYDETAKSMKLYVDKALISATFANLKAAYAEIRPTIEAQLGEEAKAELKMLDEVIAQIDKFLNSLTTLEIGAKFNRIEPEAK